MEQIIECPSCGKRYKLKGTPPPTFECRNCNTVMDLSAFREAAQPAAAAKPAAPSKPAGGRRARGGAPARGGAAASAGTPHRSAKRRSGSSARSRRQGRQEEAYEEEGGHHGYVPRNQGPNKPLIFGSLGALIICGVLLLLFMSSQAKKAEEEARVKAEQEAEAKRVADERRLEAQRIAEEAAATAAQEEAARQAAEPEKTEPVDIEDVRKELREGDMRRVPIPEGKTRYKVREAELKVFPWPDHVTAEEKAEIEEKIEWLKLGGRDQRDAQKFFKKLDGHPKPGEEFKAVGRLISEFKTIVEESNNLEFDNADDERLTMSILMVFDKVLRSIDGMSERDFRDLDGINMAANKKIALRSIRRWIWWYDLEKWHMRRVPWDPREDMLDNMEGEALGDG